MLQGCASQQDFKKDIRDKSQARHEQLAAASALEHARRSFAAGNLTNAENQVGNALAADPRMREALLLKVQILLEKSDDEEKVRNAVNAGLEQYPKEARFHYFYGLFLDRHNNRARALDEYRKAAELDPDGVQYKIAAAEMMIENSAYDEAENYLQAARKRHPGTAGIPQTLGHLAKIRKDNASARGYFAEALALAPDSDGIREDLALVCFRLEDYQEALAQLEVLSTKPEYAKRPDILMMLAQCHLAGKRPVEARKILRQILADPANESYELWQKLMEAAVLLSDRATLREAAERMISLDAAKEAGYLALARYWQMSQKPREALEALQRHPGVPSELFRRYQAQLRQEIK